MRSHQMFHSTRISLAIFIGLVTISLSCVTRKSAATVNTVPLTIVLLGPAGDAGGPLPDELIALSMPVEAKNCPAMFFIPDVKILRLDLQRDKPVEVKLSQEETWITWGRKFINKKPSAEELRSERERFLKSKQVDSVMAEDAGPDASTNDNLQRFLRASSNHKLFTFDVTRRAYNIPNSANVTIASDADDLISKMSATLCDKGHPQSAPTEYVIIYKPGTVPQPSPSLVASASPLASPTGPAPSPTATRDTGNADAAFDQLSNDVQSAFTDQTKKKSIQAQLAKAQADFSWDYRFTYERAKLAVYGTASHDEAFHHLYRAAEIAIENADQEKMYQALLNDSGEEGSFHKLSHGHQQWTTLLQALQTRNSALVKNT